MKGNVVMVELTGEERKRVIAEFERYEEEESRFVDKLKRLIDGNSYDHIKGHIEAFYDAWEEHKGITLLMEDIQMALSKQDEAVKPALLPIWRDFVNEKIGGFPIVETCTVLNGLKRDLMLLRLGDIIDYRIAKAMIQTYFVSEKGRECLNDISIYMLHAGKSKIRRCKNTCNEAELYPLLYREALRQLEKTKIGKDYKDAAKGHLIQFMKEWENTRKDEAVKSKQVASTPQQAAKMLPKELETEEAKQIFKRAIATELMEETERGYKWNGTKQLLAYFAEQMSNKFNLSDKLDKEGNTTVSWKPFEDLFGVKNLRSAKNDWMKVNTKFTPNGCEKIDDILEE